ncbi:MAG TPA: DUF1552 domain-containing protein [Polyangia bacterium]|jgi:hypothetical protein
MRKPEETIQPVVDKESGRLQGFGLSQAGVRRNAVNRRAFLRGAGTVAIGLPFLEGLPERSAWADGAQPVFVMMMVGSCGVVGKSFLPSATGPLTTAGLAGLTDTAVSALSAHAPNLTFLKNVNWVQGGPKSCGHAEGLVQSLTGAGPGSSGNTAYSSGPSSDMVISQAVNPSGTDPLALYSAAKGAYISDRISFRAGGAGQVRAGDQNPYILYSKLVGLTTASPGGGTTTDPVAAQLAATRKSINDVVRGELNSLMNNPALSADDRARLDQHFQSIRDVEVTMTNMGLMCSTSGIDTTTLDSYKSGFSFKTNGMIESVSLLHMQLVALAFACNYNRVSTLQWGDGTDGTKYSVPSNSGLGWTFHQISHRIQSDSAVGSNPTAEQAHHEIDILRMQTLAKGLDAFNSRGLASNSIVVWTTHISDGPSHSGKNVPHIIWGNGGGFLKTGQYIDAGNVTNNILHNTLITAAIRDKSTATVNFGMGTGTGMIKGMLA